MNLPGLTIWGDSILKGVMFDETRGRYAVYRDNCILRLTTDLPENTTAEEVIAFYLTFWKEEKGLFDIIVRNNLLSLLMDQCIYFLREEDQIILPFLNSPQLKADNFVLASFVSVQITLMLQWYLQNFSTPLNEMVTTYQRLVYHPLISRE